MTDEPFVNTEDCPRCGCWVVQHFSCNCGVAHGDYCLNCGRYAAPALGRGQHVSAEDKEGIVSCVAGKVLHGHERPTAGTGEVVHVVQ